MTARTKKTRDPRGRYPLPLDPALAAKLHDQRQTVKQIAVTLQCSERTVNRLLATHRQSVRTPRGARVPQFSPSAVATIRAALNLFETAIGHHTPEDIAILFRDEFVRHAPLDDTDRADLRDYFDTLDGDGSRTLPLTDLTTQA